MKNIDFETIYKILTMSFDPSLHRGYERQKSLLKDKNYNLITHKENNNIIGFISYWNINNDLIFIEHFAVDPEKRGFGVGKSLLNKVLEIPGNKVLEVEPPHTEIDKKRIKLYESFNFIFNENEYYQPPYNKGDKKTKLHIMSSFNLDNESFENIVKKIYSIVYKI